jgi:hypothetical protein
MPKPIDEDRARRKAELEKKRAARKAEKEQQEALLLQAAQDLKALKLQEEEEKAKNQNDKNSDTFSFLLSLPEDAMQVLFCMLPACDLGCLVVTCSTLHTYLSKARVMHLKSRLNSSRLQMCSNETHVQSVLRQSFPSYAHGSLTSSTDTKKTREGDNNQPNNEYLFYSSFVEEAMGCSVLSVPSNSAPASAFKSKRPDTILLPSYLQGRFASTSPEHSLCRASRTSGCASWGVGMRGQLGHGQRQDERLPKLLPQFGLDSIRIVQVSAGGGLVRVAHSLLLTSTGRVLSFGTGQYGALGHGYSAAKQLPDALRPQYVDSLKSVTCVCVAAGELHSAVVTSDGDVYSWVCV